MSQATGSEIYIGLMSGTSLDGIDAAIVDFSVYPPKTLYCDTFAYDPALKEKICKLSSSESASLDGLYSLDVELGQRYAEVVNQALQTASLEKTAIAAIGCHGQTIRHSPDSSIPYSAQIGDPNTLAARTGITTVADFRGKDIALGGQGAPLAPAFHQFLFHSSDENRALINIGGIANISYLPANAEHPVLGYDTGPGNTLLNYWVHQHKNADYDERGVWAATGKVIDNLLKRMLDEEQYFNSSPPKSTGTDYFDNAWLNQFLQDDYAAKDVQATLVELSALTIGNAVTSLPALPGSCFVCGGGAHNEYLLERLKHILSNCKIKTTDQLGTNPDYVEAIGFAWLARERLSMRTGSLAEVTQANKAAVLGGIYSAD